jgi:predicted esterase
MSSNFTIHHCEATVAGRYALKLSTEADAPGPLVIGFHGYAQSCEDNFSVLEMCFSKLNPTLCSVQGLNAFYRKNGSVVASWMTKVDRELAIENNVNYIEKVWKGVREQSKATETIFFGFSQGAAMAYRMALLSEIPCSHIIAIGGELPPELRSHKGLDDTTFMIGRGHSDPLYSEEHFQRDAKLLENIQKSVVRLSYEGAHEINEDLSSNLLKHIWQPIENGGIKE